ncbi:S46 family peptidase [Salinimonas chungwhensis]|uniref:S46 family peptidase n=1 Tax=Salinimonas chungwhensis TaxID=265425 RepID=UPI00036CA18E|nr:S46 family peptidase [Salinimonas chungwhensis]
MSRKISYLAGSVLLACSMSTAAKEGMYTPEQLPQISEDLKKTGLEISPQSLSDLTEFPMGAIVSLGGCSASFVSDKGLAVTNHHCARGSVQYNSTAENNYLEEGFLAKTKEQELPAAPGTRMYVTVEFSDVTDKILGQLSDDLTGRERFDAIVDVQKKLIQECESQPGYRCSVPSFYNGKEYKLIKQLEIQDVRIAYAPADSVGKYGGDVDNWMWPRHTGDFAFYRAYVSKDGKPAAYAEDNVPYKPEHVLKVSAAGLQDGDFVMAAGYPGSTDRYARLVAVKHTFNWLYPTYIDLIETWIKTIEDAAPEGSDARIKYESTLAGLNNFLKNTKGQIAGAQRVGLVKRRESREASLNEWLANSGMRESQIETIEQLDEVEEQQALLSKQTFWYRNITRPQLLSAGQRLYRNAIEQQKPDEEREPGYQDRDQSRLQESMQRIERRFDPTVDKAVWATFINQYLQQPESARIAAFDDALGLSADTSKEQVSEILDRYYAQTKMDDADYRLAMLEKSPEAFKKSNDPFIALAVALYDIEMENEDKAKSLSGEAKALSPGYMQAIIDWQKSQGSLAYPDANSTLRVTYGNVLGGSPKDGLIYEPFTRLQGIVEKDTGESPFNAPEKQLALIKEKTFGPYEMPSLNSVPVNFLSDLDSTGGNSGSATMNGRAELVGLLFDGTFESVNSDWDFDPKTTRTIHVDTRYMLWVMEYVDGATNLIDEMDVVREETK